MGLYCRGLWLRACSGVATSCGKALPGLDCELGLAAIAGPGGLLQAAARSGKGFAWAAR